MNYYGDKISNNIIVTDEGYLVCMNVPIGRIGYMDYLGQELPSAFNLPFGHSFKVRRTAEELFRPETIASFEGKPVTNCHPTNNLDINTAAMTKRGHVQNVRREGDYLVADLFVDDPLLIQEIQSGAKRNVSGGYDCSWHDIGNGEFEQRDILGNHVAVVKDGRAGPRVSIKDHKPEEITGGKKMQKVTKSILQAIGFKKFVQDAEPEQVAEALEALKEEPEVKDAEPEAPVGPATGAEPEQDDSMEKIAAILSKILDRIEALEEQVSGPGEPDEAETMMDEACKEEPEEEEPEAEEEKKEELFGAEDEAPVDLVKKFVQDMKPIIMSIPDEKLRLEGAKRITTFVKDSKPSTGKNGYATIMKTAMDHKVNAAAKQEERSMADAATIAAAKWQERGKQMEGGK